MARPSKGAYARSLMASLRITPDEEERLVLRYGTISAGLRAAVDTLLGPSSAAPTPKPAPKAEPKHRHTRGNLLRTEWVAGEKVRTYSCSCGKEITG